ncbi:hypothetical protein D3875_03880 [Deinococcus cavernae]|uniref:Uncharacterized protein n=1 Tax=Deinococcus cavernae TaxID=2320857 RepID=A0A418VEA8_9DEIO|nr:hypothetical protein [Deinococcus cavernae]RJF74425.1 hypothetical protein D3875_03880 [Deinococcus cavernae]
MKIEITVTDANGKFIASWGEFTPLNDWHAVDYLGQHFAGHSRATLSAALAAGRLVGQTPGPYGPHTLTAIITP